jgi:hypothetical protein
VGICPWLLGELVLLTLALALGSCGANETDFALGVWRTGRSSGLRCVAS